MNARTDCGHMLAVHGPGMLQEANRQEIERAIDNAKRSTWDKWFRRQWYRVAARRKKRFSSHRPRTSGARRW